MTIQGFQNIIPIATGRQSRFQMGISPLPVLLSSIGTACIQRSITAAIFPVNPRRTSSITQPFNGRGTHLRLQRGGSKTTLEEVLRWALIEQAKPIPELPQASPWQVLGPIKEMTRQPCLKPLLDLKKRLPGVKPFKAKDGSNNLPTRTDQSSTWACRSSRPFTFAHPSFQKSGCVDSFPWQQRLDSMLAPMEGFFWKTMSIAVPHQHRNGCLFP